MTCPNCASMAAELAELRSALGLAEMSGSVFAVREALGLSPTTARLVLKLYSAAGRPVEKKALDSVLSEGVGGQCLKVHIWRIRQLVGSDLIETVPGYGYRLSPSGMDWVGLIISPKVAA